MKNILFLFAIVGLAVFSCKKDETKVQLLENPGAPSITNPVANSTIAVGRFDSLTVYKFTWNATPLKWDTAYSTAPVVTYIIEADAEGNQFANAFTIATVTTNSYSTTLFEINKLILSKFNISTADSLTTTSLELRVKSKLANNSILTSAVVPFKVTTWRNKAPVIVDHTTYIYIAGDFTTPNWQQPNENFRLASPTDDKRYEGWFYIPAAGKQYKLYGTPTWGDPSWGDSTEVPNKLKLANYAGGNFTVPAAGLYQISVKLDSMKWYQNRITWSILGDATPGGWNTDTDLTPDATFLKWTVTCNMTPGSYKFRANHAWDIDLTQDPTKANGLVHANNKWLEPYNSSLGNISVATAGNYTLTMDLSVPGHYTYKAVKN